MGADNSKRVFNFCNEIHVIAGCGLVGFVVALYRFRCERPTQVILSLLPVGILIAYLLMPTDRKRNSKNNVIFLTGCDSGLGFAMARHLSSFPVTVIASFYDINSEGALEMKKVYDCKCDGMRLHIIELDITKSDSIAQAVDYVRELLYNSSYLELSALVNNSGVMAFGEFEWQTDAIITHQLSVNLMGTMRLTHAMLPILRRCKGRVLTVTSHCAIETLPGLSVYGATKKGLSGWMDALRVEMKPYGVKVVCLIPGSFVMSSNISARQDALAEEMAAGMDVEQRDFYGEYFDRYNNYLSSLSGDKPPGSLRDPNLMRVFEGALFDTSPAAVYKCEPPRYKLYFAAFRWCPTWMRDRLVRKFVAMPKWEGNSQTSCHHLPI